MLRFSFHRGGLPQHGQSHQSNIAVRFRPVPAHFRSCHNKSCGLAAMLQLAPPCPVSRWVTRPKACAQICRHLSSTARNDSMRTKPLTGYQIRTTAFAVTIQRRPHLQISTVNDFSSTPVVLLLRHIRRSGFMLCCEMYGDIQDIICQMASHLRAREFCPAPRRPVTDQSCAG